jgi:predicted nucleic acid-binding protein
LNSSFVDFEDAVQYYCASSIDSGYIITNNKKDFIKAQIPVMTANEWLNKTDFINSGL